MSLKDSIEIGVEGVEGVDSHYNTGNFCSTPQSTPRSKVLQVLKRSAPFGLPPWRAALASLAATLDFRVHGWSVRPSRRPSDREFGGVATYARGILTFPWNYHGRPSRLVTRSFCKPLESLATVTGRGYAAKPPLGPLQIEHRGVPTGLAAVLGQGLVGRGQ